MVDMSYGIALKAEANGIGIYATQRADLLVDRLRYQAEVMADQKAAAARGALRPILEPDIVGIVELPDALATAKALPVLTAFWSQRGRVVEGRVRITRDDAAATLAMCRAAWSVRCVTLRHVTSRVTFAHQRHDVIAWDDVPDPSMSDAEYWHRLASSDDGTNIATVLAAINMVTLIGGLARLPERDHVHEEAARLFRLAHQRATLGSSPRAIDYSGVVRVDGGRSPLHYAIGSTDQGEYRAAVRSIGMMAASVVEPVVIYDESISSIARRRYGRASGQARKKVTAEFRAGMDLLATHYGLYGRAARASGIVSELWGDRPPLQLPAAS